MRNQNMLAGAALMAVSAASGPKVYGYENIRRTIQSMRKSYFVGSKNSDPSYRKSIWPEGKVAIPGRMG